VTSMEECSRNFWIGEWQTEQLLPLLIAKTGCIESEITPLLINIYRLWSLWRNAHNIFLEYCSKIYMVYIHNTIRVGERHTNNIIIFISLNQF